MPRILVVEDNPLVAKFYRMSLERVGGHEVTCSEDVEEILQRVRASLADLAILDVSLRNCHYDGHSVDGLEIARLIRALPEGKKLPILLATAHAMEGDRERLLVASGADAYLEKPIYDPKVLIEQVDSLLRETPRAN
jgi:two-component system, cell cycle response regulator DivK